MLQSLSPEVLALAEGVADRYATESLTPVKEGGAVRWAG